MAIIKHWAGKRNRRCRGQKSDYWKRSMSSNLTYKRPKNQRLKEKTTASWLCISIMGAWGNSSFTVFLQVWLIVLSLQLGCVTAIITFWINCFFFCLFVSLKWHRELFLSIKKLRYEVPFRSYIKESLHMHHFYLGHTTGQVFFFLMCICSLFMCLCEQKYMIYGLNITPYCEVAHVYNPIHFFLFL